MTEVGTVTSIVEKAGPQDEETTGDGRRAEEGARPDTTIAGVVHTIVSLNNIIRGIRHLITRTIRDQSREKNQIKDFFIVNKLVKID